MPVVLRLIKALHRLLFYINQFFRLRFICRPPLHQLGIELYLTGEALGSRATVTQPLATTTCASLGREAAPLAVSPYTVAIASAAVR